MSNITTGIHSFCSPLFLRSFLRQVKSEGNFSKNYKLTIMQTYFQRPDFRMLKTFNHPGKRLFVVLIAIFSLATSTAQVVHTAAGPTAAAILPAVNQFRLELGTLNPNVPGPLAPGRREINWDGVPDAFSAPNNFPPNFFNTNSPRGAVFATPGTGFQVSGNAGAAPVEFGNIDPSYPTLFAPFSPQRLFTPVGSNITDVLFFIPGTNTPALTRGFGAVFSDVDIPPFTSIQLFGQNGASLGTFIAPGIISNESFSFLGISFPTAVIARVRITTGNASIAAGVSEALSARDLVVMDDFIYGEPALGPGPRSNLTITKATSSTASSGQTLTYTITITNQGPDAAQNITMTDILPAGVTFESVVSPTGWTTTAPIPGPGGTLSSTIGSMALGASATFILNVRVSSTLPANSTISNTATVSSTSLDENLSNNSATVTTTLTCPEISVSIPDALAATSGVQPNTVYPAYEPASSITLNAAVTGGAAPYNYTWSNGSTSASITVSPNATTTYSVSVTDQNGCPGNSASKTIQVADVSGGKKNDKVVICHQASKQKNTLTIGADGVADHLGHGDILGACPVDHSVLNPQRVLREDLPGKNFSVQVFPNPSSRYFVIRHEGNATEVVQLKVTDIHGRIIERREIQPKRNNTIGENYRVGVYLIEVTQGSYRKQLKLVKSR